MRAVMVVLGTHLHPASIAEKGAEECQKGLGVVSRPPVWQDGCGVCMRQHTWQDCECPFVAMAPHQTACARLTPPAWRVRRTADEGVVQLLVLMSSEFDLHLFGEEGSEVCAL